MHDHSLNLAAFVLVALGAFFLPASWWARRNRPVDAGLPRTNMAGGTRATEGSLKVIAASFLAGAAAIHFAALPEHAAQSALFGQAFAALALGQSVLALGVLAGTAWVRPAAIGSSALVVGVWLVSRSFGLPIGPDPWVPEAIGTADVIATALELGAIAVLAVGFDRRMQARSRFKPAADAMTVVAVPAVGIAGVATLIALAALLGGPSHLHS